MLIADWNGRFQQFAARKEREALGAAISPFTTELDRGGDRFVAIGNDWSRRLFDGPFYVSPPPSPELPSTSLVFVQSRDGNTGAKNPASLGGGDADAHLIYEGLSRVADDAVLTGAETIRGGNIVFSTWHPELVALRASLGMPRHPIQIVATLRGMSFEGLLFNVPEIKVLLHIWFYFAWERDANTGSGFIAYEFQRAALSASCVYTGAGIDMILPQSAAETTLINTCNPWRNRQAGDFLILWDQSGSALNITKRVFTLSGGQLVLGPTQALGSAVAAISADGFRGEAAIDLTTDVFPADGSCVNFANIIPGTVTGNSDSADYKDTVLAAFAPISSCGIVTVTKVTQPGGLTGNFPYTLQRADGSQIRFDGTLAINQTLTHDGDSTGSPILNLKAATNYTLTEGTQTSPWQLVSISCTTDAQPPVDLTSGGTFAVDANTLTACTTTNRRLRGSIQVIKHVVNDNGGTAVASAFTITLGDSAHTTFAGMESPGVTYTFDEGYAFNVTEIGLANGYVQTSAVGDCSGAIAAGVTKVCTITNDDTRASPTAATVMAWVLRDSATLTGIRPGAPDASSATVTFRLYGPGDTACTAAINGSGEVRPVVSGGASTVVGFSITEAQIGQYRWVASYSGDQFNDPYVTACGAETHTISIP